MKELILLVSKLSTRRRHSQSVSHPVGALGGGEAYGRAGLVYLVKWDVCITVFIG